MGPKIKKSSLEDSDSDLQLQIPGAANAPRDNQADDLGTHELSDGRGLKWLI